MEYSPHKGPEDQEKERIPDIEALRKKLTIDMLNEKIRQRIRHLPLHEQIKLTKEIMNGYDNKKI